MADAIAVLTLGLQYSLIVFVIDLYSRAALPRATVIGVFIAFAAIAIAIWHEKKVAENAARWGVLALLSIALGLSFFACDWLIAYVNGVSNPLHFSGGPLGLTLTFLVCPCSTMVCVAGVARALYIARVEGT
ncbi:MAG: hypothetical protein WBD23_13485 [Candidatus Acidiferrales bacterium]